MSLFRDDTIKGPGSYIPGPAPTFISPTPANGSSFTVNAGTNATYATFAATGIKGNFIRFGLTGSLPDGVTLNAATGILSGTQPALSYGHIGSTNADAFGAQNNVTLTTTYGNPTKSFSFTVSAQEYDPSLTLVSSTSRSYTMTLQIPFKFRQILTRGYTISGYQNGNTWRSINVTINATDTTSNVGDLIDRSFNYKAHLNGHSIHYALGTTNAHNAYSNYTSAYDMRTDTQFGNRMNANASYGMAAPMWSEYYWGWCTGGGFSATEEFNLTTETRTSNNVADSGSSGAGGATGGLWAMVGETFGITYDGGYQRTFTYSTRTYSGRGAGNPGNNMQQKSINSKNGLGWAGGDGSYAGGYFLRKTNMINDTLVSGNIGAKPAQNTGEENMTLGQDHQYCIGTFDGAQNNRAWRFNYATDSGFEGGASMQSKAVPGRSSSTNGWRD